MRFLKCTLLPLFFSATAYGHLVQPDPEFAEKAGGNQKEVEDLRKFCFATGLKGEDCLDNVIGSDPDNRKAAIKCSAKVFATIASKLTPTKDPNEPEGARSHEFGGVRHLDYQKSKEEGVHRYDYTPEFRDKARREYELQLMRDYNDKRQEVAGRASQSSEFTKTGSLGGQGGTKAVPGIDISGNVEISKSDTKSSSVPPLTEKEIAQFKKESEAAYANPKIMGYEPDAICVKDKPTCSSSSSTPLPNKDYKQPAQEEVKGKKEESGQRGASNDGGTKNPDPIETVGGKKAESDSIITKDHGKWAGEPSPRAPGEMWARRVEPSSVMPKTFIEQCMEAEASKAKRFKGSSTEDPRHKFDEEARKEQAKDNLDKGICDVDVYGYEFCAEVKRKLLETLDLEGAFERDLRDVKALEDLERLGLCDSSILGSEVCRQHQRELDEHLFVPLDLICTDLSDSSCQEDLRTIPGRVPSHRDPNRVDPKSPTHVHGLGPANPKFSPLDFP